MVFSDSTNLFNLYIFPFRGTLEYIMRHSWNLNCKYHASVKWMSIVWMQITPRNKPYYGICENREYPVSTLEKCDVYSGCPEKCRTSGILPRISIFDG